MVNPVPPHRRHGGSIRPRDGESPGAFLHRSLRQVGLPHRQAATGPKHATPPRPGQQWPDLPFPSLRELWAYLGETFRSAPWTYKALVTAQIFFTIVIAVVAVIGAVTLIRGM